MASIVDIDHRLHKDFAILDSKTMIVAEPKVARLDSNYFVKTELIVVVWILVIDLVGDFSMVFWL